MHVVRKLGDSEKIFEKSFIEVIAVQLDWSNATNERNFNDASLPNISKTTHNRTLGGMASINYD